MQDRGLAAYIAELIGTLLLTFAIGMVVSLFVATGASSATGSDYVAVGLVQGLTLFSLIMVFGQVSGGHFNPAVTIAAAALRRIDPVDAVVYILAQLSGGVLGALLVKGLILDEGRAAHYGAPEVSSFLSSPAAGAIVEALGAMMIVIAVCAVALNPRARQEWAPLTIGLVFTVAVIIFGPLTGASFNPARWFGPALIGDFFNGFAGIWPYVVGPIVGGLIAAGLYRFIIAGPQYAEGPEPPTSQVRGVAQAVKDAEVRERNK